MRRMVGFGSRVECVRVSVATHSAWWLVLLLAMAGATSQARAQAEPVSPEEYEQEVGAALEDHEAGRFEAARAHFLRAHEVFPNARTLRGLGKVAFELGDFVGALRYLDDALDAKVRPLSPELRDEVSALRERARGALAELVVDMRPERAQVSVDGALRGSGPRVRLLLTAGEHVLDAQASGRLAQRRHFAVHAGDRVQLTLELLPLEPLVDRPPPAQAKTADDLPPRRKAWAWALGGVLLAGAASAAIVVATRNREQTRAVPPGADWTVTIP